MSQSLRWIENEICDKRVHNRSSTVRRALVTQHCAQEVPGLPSATDPGATGPTLFSQSDRGFFAGSPAGKSRLRGEVSKVELIPCSRQKPSNIFSASAGCVFVMFKLGHAVAAYNLLSGSRPATARSIGFPALLAALLMAEEISLDNSSAAVLVGRVVGVIR